MRVAVETDVAVPRQAVWDYLADADQRFDFIVGLTRWQRDGKKRGGLGARHRMELQVGSVELGGIVEIVDFDPPHDLAWSAVTGVEQRGRWRLRPRPGGGTRVELRVTYHAPGGLMGALADVVASPIVTRHLQRSLDELKRRLEHRAHARPTRGAPTGGAPQRARTAR
jgi:uncharacterized membrane protein